MDDINYARYRNIELETELRLVKKQLAQAQAGTQYLINCLSDRYRGSLFNNADATGIETHPRLAREEDEQLRCGDYLTQTIHGRVTSKSSLAGEAGTQHVQSIHLKSPHHSDNHKIRDVDLIQLRDEDLLTLDDEYPSSSQNTVSPISANSSQGNLLGSSLIDSPLDIPLTPITPPYDRHDVFRSQSVNEHIGLGISDLDLSEQDIGEWRACGSPSPAEPVPIFSRAFADHEHNRLMGSAMFVEDMSKQEQIDHWREFANKNRRHSAEEWKMYYDQVIRPTFLAKLGGRAVEKAVDEQLIEHSEIDGVDENDEAQEVIPDHGLQASIWAPGIQEKPMAQSRLEKHPAHSEREARVHGESCANIETHGKPAISTESDSGDSLDPVENCGLDKQSRDRTEQSGVSFSKPMSDERKSLLQAAPHETLAVPETPANTAILGRGSYEMQTELNMRSLPHQNSSPKFRPAEPPACLFKAPRSVSDILFNITSTSPNLFRTVLISNISPQTKLSAIVSKVRGGQILSATLLETAGMKTSPPTETNAAMIVFLDAQSARAYVDFCIDHPILFSSTNGAQRVRATAKLVNTPSRPLHPKLLADIQNGLTRVLFVVDEKVRWMVDEVVAEFSRCGIRIPFNAGTNKDGTLFFEFADVRDAGSAWAVVDSHHWFFGGVRKGFSPDPCAQPFGDLKLEGRVGEPKRDEGGNEETFAVVDSLEGNVNGKHKTDEKALE